MHNLHLARWIIGTIFAFLLGGGLVVAAFVETKGSPGFADLYPGGSMIAAGCVMIAFLKYLTRPGEGEDQPAEDPTPLPNNETVRKDC